MKTYIKQFMHRRPASTPCGLNGHAIDFAKFGQIFLQGGTWQGRQLIPASWVAESTNMQVPTSAGSYDYFWWMSSPDGKHSHYYAYGNLGQYLYIVPEQHLLFVRFGTGYGGVDWPGFFEQLSAQIQKA